jgi:hypothetical protein
MLPMSAATPLRAALRGSIAITDQAFVFAGYTDQSTTVFGEDLNFTSYNLGLGYA